MTLEKADLASTSTDSASDSSPKNSKLKPKIKEIIKSDGRLIDHADETEESEGNLKTLLSTVKYMGGY